MAKTQQKQDDVFMVRLKPRNEKRGIKLRRYSVFGHRFDEEAGWYRVSQFVMDVDDKTGTRRRVDLIDYLKRVRNDNDDPHSPLAFDVCTPSEAEALDKAEEEAINARAKASDIRVRASHPNDLTSREVRGGRGDDEASERRRARAIKATPAPDAESDGKEEEFDPDEDLGAK